MDCSLPGSPVHGILQARILEWVAVKIPSVTFCPLVNPIYTGTSTHKRTEGLMFALKLTS